jgi:hypothetical protein
VLKVWGLTGEDGVDPWRGEEWDKMTEEADVVACTPDVLLKALSRAFLKVRFHLSPRTATFLSLLCSPHDLGQALKFSEHAQTMQRILNGCIK